MSLHLHNYTNPNSLQKILNVIISSINFSGNEPGIVFKLEDETEIIIGVTDINFIKINGELQKTIREKDIKCH